MNAITGGSYVVPVLDQDVANSRARIDRQLVIIEAISAECKALLTKTMLKSQIFARQSGRPSFSNQLSF